MDEEAILKMDDEAIDASFPVFFPALQKGFRKEMCGYFCWPGMEGNWGDLDDMIRTSVPGGASIADRRTVITSNWRPPSDSPGFLTSTGGRSVDDCAGPSSQSGDTLLRELGDATCFGIPGTAAGLVKINMDVDGEDGGATAGGGGDDGTSKIMKQEVLGGDKVKTRPRSIFAAGFPQVSHGVKASSMGSPKEIKPSPVRVGDTAEEKASSVSCPLDKEGLRTLSPRAPGIKRRKDQAKKVVCIPAPAAASSRPSGEVVPSDFWAWRKYGQKPIKGSPYPRGYYRCSSSKGCSARKHVERSRTDPSMLVITYTSEHNHPWPTQKNALAGSTRSSQPPKNSPLAVKNSPRCQRPPAPTVEEHKEEAPSTATSAIAPPVKEEAPDMEMTTSTDVRGDHELDHGICSWDYGPMDDFFADLGELASRDTMGNGLVFSNSFLEDKPDERRENSTNMDPFSSTFDSWVSNSFGEAVKRIF